MTEFLNELMKAGFNALVKLAVGFSIGTAAGAAVCWYYGIPVGFSVIGGILVLGIAIALMSDLGFLQDTGVRDHGRVPVRAKIRFVWEMGDEVLRPAERRASAIRVL